ncbi:response regulator transcription factor [Rothia halotolerans]|uniref:response regulator transcription factor n=1 Tax=Rothia halotolerans TaxID=405770 RepID=UPI003B5036C8
MSTPPELGRVRVAARLRLVAEGASNGLIAQRLYISHATVKSHLVHIYTKLGVSSRTAAVAATREAGVLR